MRQITIEWMDQDDAVYVDGCKVGCIWQSVHSGMHYFEDNYSILRACEFTRDDVVAWVLAKYQV